MSRSFRPESGPDLLLAQVLALEKVTTNGQIHYEGKAGTKVGKKVSFDLDAAGKPVK